MFPRSEICSKAASAARLTAKYLSLTPRASSCITCPSSRLEILPNVSAAAHLNSQSRLSCMQLSKAAIATSLLRQLGFAMCANVFMASMHTSPYPFLMQRLTISTHCSMVTSPYHFQLHPSLRIFPNAFKGDTFKSSRKISNDSSNVAFMLVVPFLQIASNVSRSCNSAPPMMSVKNSGGTPVREAASRFKELAVLFGLTTRFKGLPERVCKTTSIVRSIAHWVCK
mmetsp:Transcript_75620/g.130945  ORF Transcript_75620/g.130945 Transcript_75620/m.130945 type:complete len:226 (-) Transcript_75620:33-710(-)